MNHLKSLLYFIAPYAIFLLIVVLVFFSVVWMFFEAFPFALS